MQSGPGSSAPAGLPLTWERALELYLDYLHSRRTAPRTIDGHVETLSHLKDELAGRAETPADVDLGMLRRFQLGLLNRRLAPGTVANATCRIRSFFRFLFLDELLDGDPAGRLESPRVPPRLPGELVTPEDMERLLAATQHSQHPLLERAVLETLYCTGVRRGELLAVDLFDVDHRQRSLIVRAGKGEKPRVLPLVPTCYDAISRYLEYGRPELEREPDPALFLSVRGGRLNVAALARMLRRLQDQAGISDKQLTPHCFRRACATGLLNNGTNLKVIQAILGHSNLETTSVYLCLSPEEIREQVLSRHPRERFEA